MWTCAPIAVPSSNVPRRWSEELDGIRWLPRLIDKARMSARGALGAYLLGHSPVDRALLTRLGLTTAAFAQLVGQAPDDAGVLSALRRRGFDEPRVRRWSENFEQRYRAYIHLWDLDEGYVAPTPLERPLLAAFRVVEAPLMALLRKALPAP